MSTAAPLQWSLNNNGTPLYFDAWLRLGHQTGLTITQHPVETGAAISDHSYVNPRRFTFDIGMTDTINSNNVPGFPTRSISAYSLLLSLQESRQPLTLVSKYGTYRNILIETIDVSDTYVTKYALRATITLQQLILTNERNFKRSSNPQATDTTERGQLSGASQEGELDTSELGNSITGPIQQLEPAIIQSLPLPQVNSKTLLSYLARPGGTFRSIVTVPINNLPNQVFSMAFPNASNNVQLGFNLVWNRVASYWMMNIKNVDLNQSLISNLPLLSTNKYAQDLLAAYQYLNIGSAFVVPNASATTENPGLNDWERNFVMYWANE